MQFLSLVVLLERIAGINANRRQMKEAILAEQFRRWKDESKWTAEQFYSVIRLLVPFIDLSRTSSGLKEATIGLIYVDLLGLARQSPDAVAISEYEKRHLEFTDCIYHVLLPRCMVKQEDAKLTIEQVNEQLDRLYTSYTSDRRAEQKQVFNFIFQHCCAIEQKWFVRILLSSLHIGLGNSTILRLYHPKAQEYYEYCNDLRKVVYECIDSTKDPVNIKVSALQSFSAMKLKSVLPREVPELMKNEPFWIEQKLDGARFIVHYSRGQFRYFGRNGVDQTRFYGATAQESEMFSARLEPLFTKKRSNIWALILDGEMMEWDEETQSFTKQFKNYASTALGDKSGSDSSTKKSCLVVFDILLINDQVLTEFSLEQRFQLLTDVITEQAGTLQINTHTIGSTVEDVVNACESVLLVQGEGVCVKDPRSRYIPAVRGERWLKVKPDYYSELGEHLDLAVIGASYGSGSRTGTLNSFLCAIIADRNQDSPIYLPITRFGTGFDSKTREKLIGLLSPYLVQFDKNGDMPSWLQTCCDGGNGIGRRIQADLLISDPGNAPVCELKATQWIESSDYPTGWTLRFPRFCKIRDDKHPGEVMDIAEMTRMRSRPTGGEFRMLDHSKASGSGAFAASPVAKRKLIDLVPVHQRGIDQATASSISQKTKLLSGMEICVKTGDDRLNKADLERLIVEHGGLITKNPLTTTKFVLAGQKTLQVNTIEKSKGWDIVKPQWLLDSIEKNRLVPFEPHYMHFTTERTLNLIRESMDRFGDHFDQTLTAKELKEIFQNMSPMPVIKERENNDFISRLEEEYQLYPSSNLAIFRPCIVYIDCYRELFGLDQLETSPLLLIERLVRFYGGKVVSGREIWQNVTHFVIDPAHQEHLVQLRQKISKSSTKKPILVSMNWIMDSVREQSMLSENIYTI